MKGDNRNTSPLVAHGAFLDADKDGSWRDVVSRLGSMLRDAGCVDAAYVDGVLAREEQFPTGLLVETEGVALPHGDAGTVMQSALAVGRLDRPVLFRRMDEPNQYVPVRLVFLLAVTDPEGHLSVLAQLMEAISDARWREELLAATGEVELEGHVRHVLGQVGAAYE